MERREPGLQPLDDQTTGCTLVFLPLTRMYQHPAALAVIAGLYPRKLSGVCECYIQPDFRDGKYLMGVGLEFDDGPVDDDWWGAFVHNIDYACGDDEDIRLERSECEFATVEELRATMLHAGTARFEDGVAVWVSDPDGPAPDSPFSVLCRKARYDES
jgi:hypothetical protein